MNQNLIINYFNKIRYVYGQNLFLNPQTVQKYRLSSNKNTISDDIYNYKNKICDCIKCPLGKTRTNLVFGSGNPKSGIMIIGEAPGEKEDEIGEPFVGKSGKMLDRILSALQLKRDSDVYITNVVKCRPANNRDPLPSEVEKCEPHLKKQINIIKPKIIVALGRVAGKTLLKVDATLKDMRGRLFEYHNIPLFVTYHPAALLRNPNLKPNAWEDFQVLKNFFRDND